MSTELSVGRSRGLPRPKCVQRSLAWRRCSLRRWRRDSRRDRT